LQPPFFVVQQIGVSLSPEKDGIKSQPFFVINELSRKIFIDRAGLIELNKV